MTETQVPVLPDVLDEVLELGQVAVAEGKHMLLVPSQQ